nr:histone H1.8 [Dasypus novemcinctus]
MTTPEASAQAGLTRSYPLGKRPGMEIQYGDLPPYFKVGKERQEPEAACSQNVAEMATSSSRFSGPAETFPRSSNKSPRSDASSDSSASSAGSAGSQKPGPSRGGALGLRRHPPVLRMVLEALQAGERRQGTSVAAIKLYILQKYPTVDVSRLKHPLKQALAKGLLRGLLVRPVNSKARGATGSFKLVPQKKRKTRPKKMAAGTVLGKPGEKRPKKPSEAKKKAPNPGKGERVPKKLSEAKKVPPKPAAAKEKALERGSGAKAANPGEARKLPSKPAKATEGPPGAAGLGGKAKARGGSQAVAEAYRTTKAGSKSSKASATKGKKAATSPAKKKMVATAKVPAGASAPGPGEGPKAKAAAPPKGKDGKGPEIAPAHLVSKTEAPKGLGRPGLPAKSLSSKVSSKKSEARS